MFKSTWRTLLTVSIIVAVIAGIITVIWWHQRHCNDAEIVQQTDGTKSAQPTAGTEIADPTDQTETVDSTDETENSFALDAQYASSYLEATSNYEMCEVNRQFAEKWRQEAQLYLNKICEIADEDLKQAIIAGQTAWENAYPMRMEENFAYLLYVYGSGSVVPIIHSKYDYDLQRERAIELYEMYNEVKRIWDVFQEYGPLPDDSTEY